jgi:hypothetical protein
VNEAQVTAEPADLAQPPESTQPPELTQPPESTQPLESTQPAPTAAQLRRFIKSRPYVPMHELRRRFELNGELDDVTPVDISGHGVVFVGLPSREAYLLGGLVRDGDVGLELSQDPTAPIVVGVFPIRPITRN